MLMPIRCVAFDCFGTIFNMENVSTDEIRDYVRHVNSDNFERYDFPKSWWDLQLHPDVEQGFYALVAEGIQCVTLSNASVELTKHVSYKGNVYWHHVIDLVKYRVYKPHIDAYRTIELATGFKPAECLMVTANATFGDIEGAAAIGMRSQLLNRHSNPILVTDLPRIIAQMNSECGA